MRDVGHHYDGHHDHHHHRVAATWLLFWPNRLALSLRAFGPAPLLQVDHRLWGKCQVFS